MDEIGVTSDGLGEIRQGCGAYIGICLQLSNWDLIFIMLHSNKQSYVDLHACNN